MTTSEAAQPPASSHLLALELPEDVWVQLIGELLGMAWVDSQRELIGQLATQLYAAYLRAVGAGLDPVTAMTMLAERLRDVVIGRG